MDAGTLNCPNCGAAVDQNATECKFCHSFLQTVACPKCLGMMFTGTRFCPHCGARAQNLVAGENATQKCPRCAVLLKNVEVGNTPLEECFHCGGLWVDVSSFEHLCSDADSQTAATGMALPPSVASPPLRYLPCPQCGKLMSRMNYASRSGVIFSVCRAHGIWLDRDQIRQIIEFIRSGGLVQARKDETEELEMDRRDQEFNPTSPHIPFLNQTIGVSLSSDERVHLLRGVASLANHFLGGAGQ